MDRIEIPRGTGMVEERDRIEFFPFRPAMASLRDSTSSLCLYCIVYGSSFHCQTKLNVWNIIKCDLVSLSLYSVKRVLFLLSTSGSRLDASTV